MKTVILGGGRVGSAIAADLKRRGFLVLVADLNEANLNRLKEGYGVETVRVDLREGKAVTGAIHNADIVIDAVPGFLGFQTLRRVIEAGKDVVDIAFFPEDPFELDPLAQEMGVTAIVDSGVAPGMSNLLVGHSAGKLDRIDRVAIYVGGLPTEPFPPYGYRATFSPVDVIEEYTRPARIVEEGRIVERPALSDLETLEFEGVGSLEAFLTDGLRTLLQTIPTRSMVEKTLRYPGHAEKIALLRDTGLFSEEPVEVSGNSIRPIDLTAALLFSVWRFREGEEDMTVMRITVEGETEGRPVGYTYEMFDRFDRETGTPSMARTTGYTAAAVAAMLKEGLYRKPGISPLEKVASDERCVEFILSELEERGISYRDKVDYRG